MSCQGECWNILEERHCISSGQGRLADQRVQYLSKFYWFDSTFDKKVSPMPTPRGLAKLNIAQDRTKAFTFDNNLSNNSLIIFCQTILSLIFKILTERLLWAMLSPRLNAMMALCIITCSSSCSFLSQIVNLCIITAKKSVTMSPLLSWRPIASPCKNRLEQ